MEMVQAQALIQALCVGFFGLFELRHCLARVVEQKTLAGSLVVLTGVGFGVVDRRIDPWVRR